MLLANAPTQMQLAVTEGNSSARAIPPNTSQIGITNGAASFPDGFPPVTRLPVEAGGLGPDGLETNGFLYAISALTKFYSAGGVFKYNSTFASSTFVAGYPAGAILLRADGLGYWKNKVDGNTTDPDSVASAGWEPLWSGSVTIDCSAGGTIALSAAQYGAAVLVLTGTLAANTVIQLPKFASTWAIINKCTLGSYAVTAKVQDQSLAPVTIALGGNTVSSDGTSAYLGLQGTFASGAEVAAGIATDKAVTPASLQSAPLARAFVAFNGFTGEIYASFNLATSGGLTKNASGIYTVKFGTNQPPTSNYVLAPSCGGTASGAVSVTEAIPLGRSTSSHTIRTLASDMTNVSECAFVSLTYFW